MDRRTVLEGVMGVGTVGLVGCVGVDESTSTVTEELSVTVVNRLDRAFTVDIGVLEPGQSFEEGIGWRVTFGLGDDQIEVVEDDFSAARYRIVLRSSGYQDYEYDWDLEECVELNLKVEVRPERFREDAWSCRRP